MLRRPSTMAMGHNLEKSALLLEILTYIGSPGHAKVGRVGGRRYYRRAPLSIPPGTAASKSRDCRRRRQQQLLQQQHH
jgi:hypothetical protein